MTKNEMKKLLDGRRFDVRMFGKVYRGKLRVKQYGEGNRIALQGVSLTGEPLFVLTVNIPEIPLEDDEIIVKTWSENEELAKYMINIGLFEDTGKRIPTGYCEAQIWRVKHG